MDFPPGFSPSHQFFDSLLGKPERPVRWSHWKRFPGGSQLWVQGGAQSEAGNCKQKNILRNVEDNNLTLRLTKQSNLMEPLAEKLFEKMKNIQKKGRDFPS